MASPTASGSNTKEVAMEIPTFVRVYKDGAIERLQSTPIVPPSINNLKSQVSSKDIAISDNPSISARLYLPKASEFNEKQKVPILVYFHGGGFFFESAFSHLHQNYFNSFVSRINVLVVSVEYRLAPENPLQDVFDDCWAALKWVASHSIINTNLTRNSCIYLSPLVEPWLVKHGDFSRIFIGGDSAGATIAHNMALRLGDEDLPGGIEVLGAFISHPYFFGSRPIGSEPEIGHEQSVPYLVWNFVYPTAPGGLDNPLINPLAPAGPSFTRFGCSKLLVCVASNDVIRDRAVLYYQAVKNSGWQGEVEMFEVKGEDHVFHLYSPESENAKQMIQRIADFLLN